VKSFVETMDANVESATFQTTTLYQPFKRWLSQLSRKRCFKGSKRLTTSPVLLLIRSLVRRNNIAAFGRLFHARSICTTQIMLAIVEED
jgi:hypothetical protein